MKANKPKTSWAIDALLFSGFLIAFMLELTGVGLHQWLGLAIGALAGYHLLAHWSWVDAVTQRYFARTSWQARFYYLVDASLLLGFTLILATGLAISTWFSLPWSNYDGLKDLHVVASFLTLFAIVIKIGAHWRWIITVARKYMFPAAAPAINNPPHQTGSAAPTTGRREFLKLMGLVGAASVIAMASSWDSVREAMAGDAASDRTSTQSVDLETGQSLSAQADEEDSQASSTCMVRCNRRCSYPGHCRRYTDSNQNGRCDWGECA